MKCTVEFASTKFPSHESEIEGVNWQAGIWGKRLAEYLKDGLSNHGIEIADVYAEDWGWCLEIKHTGGFLHFFGCSHISDDPTGSRFSCFIEPNTPIVRKWFKKIDASAAIERVSNALQATLGSDADIVEVVWRDE